MYEDIKQWEYRVQTVGGFFTAIKVDEMEELLNDWGEEGWEVISTHIIENANKVNIIAKRPLTDRIRRERSRPSLF
jgi:hypothetical protein